MDARQRRFLGALVPPVDAEVSQWRVTLNIANTVVNVKTDCLIDVRDTVLRFFNGVYNPRKFPSLVWRVCPPHNAIQIFGGGKLVVIGSVSVEEARCSVQILRVVLMRMGYRVGLRDLQMCNSVYNYAFDPFIDLEKFQRQSELNCAHKKSTFPGLVYTCYLRDGSKITILVFETGKIIITGVLYRHQAVESIELIAPRVRAAHTRVRMSHVHRASAVAQKRARDDAAVQ